MEFFRKLFYLLRHLGEDPAWRDLITYVGPHTLYAVMFAIIFCETGLVILPFLPGDSLLFAIGAMGARDIGISLPAMAALLIVAAVLGDAVNYWIGYKLGPKVFNHDTAEDAPATAAPGEVGYAAGERRKPRWSDRLLNKKHLLKAQEFYDKYGGKTIILARFVPIVRTFAPFVAGIGKMNFFKFWAYNIIGGVAWVLLCIGAGRLFGNIEFVKKHFELVIVAIVLISVLPMVFEYLKARREGKVGVDAAEDAVGIK